MRDVMEKAIGELERAGTPGTELELAAAWRRLGEARLEDGDTPGGLAALERAFGLAEKEWTEKRELQAFESKAITLPLWALAMQTRRAGDEAVTLGRRAVAMHAEYKKLFGRAVAAQNPYWRMLLQLGPALAQRGQAEEGRALLEEALGVVGPERAKEYCEEARRVAGLPPQAGNRCWESAGR